jgi:hypothetical protein
MLLSDDEDDRQRYENIQILWREVRSVNVLYVLYITRAKRIYNLVEFRVNKRGTVTTTI